MIFWLLALLVPLVCVFGGSWAFWTLTARPQRFMEEPGIMFVQACVAAAPFAGLALVATAKSRTPGVLGGLRTAAAAGLVLTVIAWGLLYVDGYVYWKNESRGGANILAGMLMLISPFVIGAAMTVVYRLKTRNSRLNTQD